MLLLAAKLLETCHPATHPGSLLQEDEANRLSPSDFFSPLIDASVEDAPPITNDRVELLRTVGTLFDHHDQGAHDDEVDAGAGPLLFQALQEAVEESYDSEEVFLAIDALTKLTRCSDERVMRLFEEIGTVSMLQLLFLLVEMNYRLGNTRLLKLCTDLIERWASLEIDLASTKNHNELLAFLVGAIQNTSGKTTIHCATLSLECLSRPEANKTIMARSAYLLSCLFYVAQESLATETRREAARAINNLAWDSSNKDIIAASASFTLTLTLLTKDKDQESRSLAVETILHLSTSSAESKVALVSFEGGRVIERLLQIAQDFTESTAVCVSSTHALARLISPETASAMGSHHNFLDVLKYLSCGGLDSSAVATQAAMALKKVATYVNEGDECHQSVIEAVISAASSKACTQVLMWASRAIRELTLNADTCQIMVEVSGFLPTVADLCIHAHPNVQRPSLEALEALSMNHEHSAVAIASSPDIMSLLVKVALREDHLHDSIARRLAVLTMLAIANTASAAKAIAGQQELLVDVLASLSTYGSSNDDAVILRQAATQGVALLAPLL